MPVQRYIFNTYSKLWGWLAYAATIVAGQDNCPGYFASNVVTTGSTLTADLHLAGPACNVFGTDLTDLKLLVEYQTGWLYWLACCNAS